MNYPDYENAPLDVPVTYDDQGRPVVSAMTDRQIAEETLLWLRMVADILNTLGQSPMAAAIGLKVPENLPAG